MPRKGKRKNSDKDLLNLQPSEGYKDPGTPKYTQPKGRTYTSGTYNEKLTGNYYTNRPDMSINRSFSNYRSKSHGKGLARDIPSAKVTKGNKVPSAARGVGQPSIDWFIEGLEGKKKRKRR